LSQKVFWHYLILTQGPKSLNADRRRDNRAEYDREHQPTTRLD